MKMFKKLSIIDGCIYLIVLTAGIYFLKIYLTPKENINLLEKPRTSFTINCDTVINIKDVPVLSTQSWSTFITNTGNNTLYLTDLKSSCGCTTFKFEKSKIEPNESSKMLCNYHTDFVGLNTVTLSFKSNTEIPRMNIKLNLDVVKK